MKNSNAPNVAKHFPNYMKIDAKSVTVIYIIAIAIQIFTLVLMNGYSKFDVENDLFIIIYAFVAGLAIVAALIALYNLFRKRTYRNVWVLPVYICARFIILLIDLIRAVIYKTPLDIDLIYHLGYDLIILPVLLRRYIVVHAAVEFMGQDWGD